MNAAGSNGKECKKEGRTNFNADCTKKKEQSGHGQIMNMLNKKSVIERKRYINPKTNIVAFIFYGSII
jgi:hypothetical protein